MSVAHATAMARERVGDESTKALAARPFDQLVERALRVGVLSGEVAALRAGLEDSPSTGAQHNKSRLINLIMEAQKKRRSYTGWRATLGNKTLKPRTIFMRIDAGQSGFLDRGGVVDAFVLLGHPLGPAQVEKLMATMDPRGCGAVSMGEFLQFWESRKEQERKVVVQRTEASYATVEKGCGSPVTNNNSAAVQVARPGHPFYPMDPGVRVRDLNAPGKPVPGNHFHGKKVIIVPTGQKPGPLPQGWRLHASHSGRDYYFPPGSGQKMSGGQKMSSRLGSISRTQACSTATQPCSYLHPGDQPPSLEEAEEAFLTCDASGRGFLGYEQLERAFEHLGFNIQEMDAVERNKVVSLLDPSSCGSVSILAFLDYFCDLQSGAALFGEQQQGGNGDGGGDGEEEQHKQAAAEFQHQTAKQHKLKEKAMLLHRQQVAEAKSERRARRKGQQKPSKQEEEVSELDTEDDEDLPPFPSDCDSPMVQQSAAVSPSQQTSRGGKSQSEEGMQVVLRTPETFARGGPIASPRSSRKFVDCGPVSPLSALKYEPEPGQESELGPQTALSRSGASSPGDPSPTAPFDTVRRTRSQSAAETVIALRQTRVQKQLHENGHGAIRASSEPEWTLDSGLAKMRQKFEATGPAGSGCELDERDELAASVTAREVARELDLKQLRQAKARAVADLANSFESDFNVVDPYSG